MFFILASFVRKAPNKYFCFVHRDITDTRDRICLLDLILESIAFEWLAHSSDCLDDCHTRPLCSKESFGSYFCWMTWLLFKWFCWKWICMCTFNSKQYVCCFCFAFVPTRTWEERDGETTKSGLRHTVVDLLIGIIWVRWCYCIECRSLNSSLSLLSICLHLWNCLSNILAIWLRKGCSNETLCDIECSVLVDTFMSICLCFFSSSLA